MNSKVVPYLVVLVSVSLVAAIAVPNFFEARKRSRATRILEDLRMIDSSASSPTGRIPVKSNKTVPQSNVERYLKPGIIWESGDGLHDRALVGFDSPGFPLSGDQIFLRRFEPNDPLDHLLTPGYRLELQQNLPDLHQKLSAEILQTTLKL